MSAFDIQKDGTHYKGILVQPVQLAYAVFGGDTLACKVSKYLTREKDDWLKQVDKAEHCYEMFKEMSAYTHIPNELSLAQEMILDIFIKQSPKGVQQALRFILECMLGKKGNPSHSFKHIREYYTGSSSELSEDAQLVLKVAELCNVPVTLKVS